MTDSPSIEPPNAEELVLQFDYARKKAGLYPPDHRYSKESATKLFDVLAGHFKPAQQVIIAVSNEQVYVNEKLLPEITLSRVALIRDLIERGLSDITFLSEVTVEELVRFLWLTSLTPQEMGEYGGWDLALSREHISSIFVGTHVEAMSDDDQDKPERVRISLQVYRKTIRAILEAYVDARNKKKLNMELMSGAVATLVSTLSNQPDAIRMVTELKSRDEYTLSHSVNVAILSLLMGSKLRLPRQLLQRLGHAALLHDIGKAAIPEELINKPGKLTQDEWELMQNHSILGAKLLSEQDTVDPLAMVVAAEHHAREDMSGYPRFHSHMKLHPMSQIVAIVDSYDALTSNRSYRPALLPDLAMKILIDGRGTHFDANYLKVFVQLSGMYPVGTLVELDTEELAIVEKSNPSDIYRPMVKLIHSSQTNHEAFVMMDLTDVRTDGTPRASIVRSIDPDSISLDLTNHF